MKLTEKFLLLLRLALGWLFFYAGISKILDPAWSAEGYLRGAKTFASFYSWLASPDILPFTNFFNKWGLLLIGLSLLAGLLVRVSTSFGAAMMALYHLPILSFPFVGKNSLLVDEHVVFILCLLLLGASDAGKTFGLDGWRKKGFGFKKMTA